MTLDADLYSIQEVRTYLAQAKEAQAKFATYSQEQVDRIIEAMSKAGVEHADRLAAMAVEETGFGNIPDKRMKNLFAAQDVYASVKDVKTVGIIRKDEENKVWEVAQPFGIVAGIVPSTNPTSTVIYKSMVSLKARNAIVFSPHPSAAKCTLEAARLMAQAAVAAGAPEGLIHCVTKPTLPATNELMKHKLTNLILATGGTPMVRAAYSSGKPAYGVGPGNVPVYIHHSADFAAAAKRIVQSKTFDYGTICASEQALVVEESTKHQLIAALKREGAYFLNEQEKEKVAAIVTINGSLNAKIVGRSPHVIAQMAGITIPADTRVLVAEENNVGKAYPMSVEKLAPVLALYTVQGDSEAFARCRELLEHGGLGHTAGIHAQDDNVIAAYGQAMPASRIPVNTGTTFGGIGATTGVQPAFTLGCGSLGGNITSDNIGAKHMFNIKRVAFGIKEMPQSTPAPQAPATQAEEAVLQAVSSMNVGLSRDEIKNIIKSVLTEMTS
ncbi:MULTISPECIES: acetaldehyde dehydrogenase (acetylating) [Brevibacillus]|uniref:Acetaldehyde dehydrogenase (Acetylating) n=1 Tax=Brevibacillus brevis TaxID=1393 RepID=A0A2Z4MQI8_BREBE|nr:MULTISPECIES: acetaldehyde dehydrogenase (acetylating) [Brevibacillus]AWX58810.1 acetaldehyde dehydrogenase (acetylating) [Brevibacillus brevis]MBY0084888.1 acetaldehyde dehydrogenase (acetylating) [Brevibacillus brevis]MCC8433201.1 acetaldehyde dehydrogenase (acetylating) [Brevibacillus sp. M2.1A]MCE0452317.1 acetaldehyde dehydrogenase (acetylating) [Brevibacillus sp. AF8]MCM3143493.1 acetaldehyde dehydrogenase (acetylating) [Brevibacillus sp. MER 51]